METRKVGIILGLLSGMFWGSMDVASQYLLHQCGMKPGFFISVTMVVTAVCMLLCCLIKYGLKTFKPLGNWKDIRDLVIFAALILGTEGAFFTCVKFSNASTAAVLASTRPFWIMGIIAAMLHIRATWKQILCGILAIAGVTLLVTKGNLGEIKFSLIPICCGLGAAIFSASYTVQSRPVVKRVGAFLAAAWGMTIATLFANVYAPVWSEPINWSFWSVFCILWVGIVGHICAYCCYLASAGKINPSVTGLLETVEPLTAVVLSFILFHTFVDVPMGIGFACILISVVILSFTKKP